MVQNRDCVATEGPTQMLFLLNGSQLNSPGGKRVLWVAISTSFLSLSMIAPVSGVSM